MNKGKQAQTALAGSNPLEVEEIRRWKEFSTVQLADIAHLEHWLGILNNHLQLRTYMTGYHLSNADLDIVKSLRACSKWKHVVKNYAKGNGDFHHLMRWFRFVDPNVPQEEKAKPKKGKAGGKMAITLEGAEDGKVVTRFPPEPSGFLHIGHTKAALLNQFFARQYNGKMIVRFDDTNPSKEKEEFVDNILRDLTTLGVKPDILSHTSDHFALILKYCTKMIKEGKAYCDKTPVEEMRKQKMERQENDFRSASVDENMRLWNEMQKGSEEGRLCCVRAKIDMKSLNGTMRDPVLYRCNVDDSHLRTGNKYKVYPTYDFACPIVDSTEGVTHALRTTEFHDRNDQYAWVLEALGLRPVRIWDFSRLNFVHTVLSKRKLQWFVDNHHVEGWDDPRVPTVQGIMRRGLSKEGLLQFIIGEGASKNINLMQWGKLWQYNRKIIDAIAPRHTSVSADNVAIVHLESAKTEHKTVPKHKRNPDLGDKIVTYSDTLFIEGSDASRIVEGEEVTMMNWGNVIIDKIVRNEGKPDEMYGRLHLEGDFKKTEKKLNWLANDGNALQVLLVDFDYLITKAKLEEGDSMESCLNTKTRIETSTYADANVRALKKGDIIQFERRGFFIVDQPYVRAETPMVFFQIPDGHDKAPSKLDQAEKNVQAGEVAKRRDEQRKKK